MKQAAPWLVAGLAATLAAGGLALAQPNDRPAAPAENNLYRGDLHLHTDQSPDAFLTGRSA